MTATTRLSLHPEPVAAHLCARRLYDAATAAADAERFDPLGDAERERCLLALAAQAERLMARLALVARPGSTTFGPTYIDRENIGGITTALLSWGVTIK